MQAYKLAAKAAINGIASSGKKDGFLANKKQLKKLIEEENVEQRKIAFSLARERYSPHTSVHSSDYETAFLNRFIYDVFDRHYINESVREALTVNDTTMRQEVGQRIRKSLVGNVKTAREHYFLGVRYPEMAKDLMWSLYREAVHRTARRPTAIKELLMEGQLRRQPDVTRFYHSKEYLIRAAGAKRVYFVSYGNKRVYLRWKNFTEFDIVPASPIDDRYRRAMDLNRIAAE